MEPTKRSKRQLRSLEELKCLIPSPLMEKMKEDFDKQFNEKDKKDEWPWMEGEV